MRIDRLRGGIASVFLVLCFLLGGASGKESGALANGILQVVALSFILFALWSRPSTPYPPQAKTLTWIVLAYLLYVLLSLIPLPSGIWETLPGRESISGGFALLGIDDASIPLSLTPQRTISSILWLLPPAAMFLLTLQSSHEKRKALPWALIAIAVVSIMLGAGQLLGGPDSRLRLYSVTIPDRPVGFFAGTNGFTSLLICSIPFAAYIAARSTGRRKRGRAGRSSGKVLSIAILVFLFVGIAAIGSFAGYGLAVPTAAASYLIYLRASSGTVPRKWAIALVGLFTVFLVLAVSGPLDQQRLVNNFADAPETRRDIALKTAEAAAAYFPVGSGLGSFEDIYRTLGDPNHVSFEYVNHAHNEYLEIALELGLIGILLMVAFIAWWVIMTFKAWRSDEEGANLARAGSVAIAIVLLHSLVDFPARTSAIAALLAMSCALMIRPWVRVKRPAEAPASDQAGGLRHLQVD